MKQFWNEALTERKLEKQVVWSAFEEETSHVTPYVSESYPNRSPDRNFEFVK